MMVHHDAQAPTFDEFFLAEFHGSFDAHRLER